MKALLLSAIFAVVLCGCASTPNGSVAKDIAVFQVGESPIQQYTVLGTLKDDAAEHEEDEITEEFKKKARKMGGDAIIFRSKKQSGMEVKPFSFGKLDITYLYTVDVLRFQ